MIGRRLALCLLVLSLVACGSEGGSSGTGISGGTSGTGINSNVLDDALTTIEGNVLGAQEARLERRPGSAGPWLARLRSLFVLVPAAVAQSGVEGVRVRVEGTDYGAETDGGGYFGLQGRFGGTVGVLFEKGDGSVPARLEVTVPKGGVLTLEDVFVDFESGEASPEVQEVRFAGIVTDADCVRRIASVASRYDPEGPSYAVRTGSGGASITDGDGDPIACRELRDGREVQVSGGVGSDGTIGGAGGREPGSSLGVPTL